MVPILVVRSAEGSPFWLSPLSALTLRCGTAKFSCCQQGHKSVTATQKIMSPSNCTKADIQQDIASKLQFKASRCDKNIIAKILSPLISGKVEYFFEREEENAARFYLVLGRRWMEELPTGILDNGDWSDTFLKRDPTLGVVEGLKKLLRWREGHDDEAANNDGFSLLMISIMMGDLEAFDEIVNSERFPDEFVLPVLKEEGFPELGIPGYATGLHFAAQLRSPDMIQRLLDAGADPYVTDAGGLTAMHWACVFGRLSVIKFWFERFPDWNLELKDSMTGGTVLTNTAYTGQNKTATIQLLLEKGANVGARTGFGSTALHAACEQEDSDPKTVDTIIKAFKESQLCDIDKYINMQMRGQTIKYRFIQRLARTLYRCRLANSVLSGVALESGNTALHQAVARGDVEVVQRLLLAGANPTIRNDLGMDAFAFSRKVGPFPEIEAELAEWIEKMGEREKRGALCGRFLLG